MPTLAQIEQMRSTINTYTQKKNDIMLAYLRMNETVSMLVGESWTGEAAQRFNEEFDAMYANLRTSSEQVSGAIRTLNTVIEKLEATEADLNSAAEGLDEGTVPSFL